MRDGHLNLVDPQESVNAPDTNPGAGETAGSLRLFDRAVQMLPPHLINRIAAGEVVERPASVVKELVENALDAGASQIAISIGTGGRSIRVADNGHGMHEQDALLAFYNHATSKLHNETELDRIQTLGFRGEALASIASISKMSCLTRRLEAAQGIKVSISELGEPSAVEAGCAPGTVMTVDDLFYNTPARLKFLKRPQTELGHIEETVQFLALSHPDVRFSLHLSEKEALRTSGTGSLKKTLEELFPIARDRITLIPVTFDEDTASSQGEISLAGFVSEPGFMKSGKRWMMTFVNGRHVRCSILSKAIEAAYESLLPSGRYPLAALFLNLPFQNVDVNVHPTKREVRYLDSGRVFGFVKAGLRQSLGNYGIRFEPTTPFPAQPLQNFPEAIPLSASDISPTNPGTSNDWSLAQPSALLPKPEFSSQASSRHFFAEKHTSPDATQTAFNFYKPPTTPNTETEGNDAYAPRGIGGDQNQPDNPAPSTSTALFKVIGQLFNTYILLETAQGLLVVDQHIASERTFFEALTLNLTGSTPLIQHRLGNRGIDVSPVQKDLLNKHQDEFKRLGFLYSIEGNSAQLSGIPLVYSGRDGLANADQHGGLFDTLLTQLEETGEMKLDLDPLIATLACHSAVRAGDTLTLPEMETVIQRWLACELPWTCPHGRPIAHTISKSELNKFFHRTSLPVGN